MINGYSIPFTGRSCCRYSNPHVGGFTWAVQIFGLACIFRNIKWSSTYAHRREVFFFFFIIFVSIHYAFILMIHHMLVKSDCAWALHLRDAY